MTEQRDNLGMDTLTQPLSLEGRGQGEGAARAVAVRPDRIAARFLDARGRAPAAQATLVRAERCDWGEARHYELRIADCGSRIDVQVNHGDADAALRDAAETALREEATDPRPQASEEEA
ncbi:MAG TPA: hypothetical protein DCX07_14195 [Phycisphaerales bacterium]|nr:hypothetical protein [Phycisphaerales bacterium]